MKVLVVLDCFYPNIDGPIWGSIAVAQKFAEKGLGTVDLLVPDYPERVEVEGLTVHRSFSIPATDGYRAALPMFSSKVKKIIKNGGYDVIHLRSPFTLARYALKCARKYKIPVVFTMHTKFRDEFESRLKSEALQKFMLNYVMKCINACDSVTAVSRGTVATLAEYGYKQPEKIKVVYNGTSMPVGAVDPAEVEKIRRKFGLGDKFVFIFVGRLAEVKRVQFSLEALSRIKKQGIDGFKFLIVGDGAYGKTLKKLTATFGLEENVVFVGKVADKKELAKYYGASNLLLFPSVFDTAGVVIFEAAANGVPSVTLTGSCAAERITDGVSGFVWENDLTVWTENLIKLIEDPALSETAGEGAKNEVYLGWDRIAQDYYEVYKELLP